MVETQLKTVKIKCDDFDTAKKNKKAIKANPVASLIIRIVLLVLLLVSAARVPYTGCYLDSIFFEFLFGITKYFVYLYFLLLLILSFIKTSIATKLLRKMSMIKVWFFILIISICTIIASVNWEFNIGGEWGIDFKTINKTYTFEFFEWMKIANNYDHFFFFVNGGFLGMFMVSIFVSILWVTIIIIFILLFIFSIIAILGKTNSTFILKLKAKIIKMLGDETVKEKLTQNIELKKKPEDTEVVKIKDSQIKEKLSLPTPPVEFLTDTSILNSQLIETEAKTLLERLITFLNSKNISITSTNINVMPLFKEISFKTKNVKDSDAIIRLQREICKAMSVTECNINFKDTFISFEIPNVNKEKISISNLMEKVKGTKNTSVIGIDNNHTPLNLNYNNSHINLIIGKIGGGGNMLLSVLITSFAYLNSVNEGEIVIFNVLEKNLTIFKDLPHLIEPIVMQENTYTKFKELKQHLESRIEKLSIFKYVDAYNKSNSDKKIKNLLIVIPNIDFLINSNSEYLLLIDELISLVKKADASIIFTMHGINGEFVNLPNYKNINSKFIFKLGTEYESLLLFDNYRGLQLYGNGDGFAFLNSNNKIRFQSCYINQSEIKNTVDTLNRFYLEKLK